MSLLLSTFYSSHEIHQVNMSVPTNPTVPSTCKSCSPSGVCLCAAQAKCSCGKQAAMHCNCEKAATENKIEGARCSCRKCVYSSPALLCVFREESTPAFILVTSCYRRADTAVIGMRAAGECTCGQSSRENVDVAGPTCSCGNRAKSEISVLTCMV